MKSAPARSRHFRHVKTSGRLLEKDEQPVIGRITFASGEKWDYIDPEKYLQAVREELPFQATTGFRCETLTDDPEIRKAVDDMICDLYGEENPRILADYGNNSMKVGGMGLCIG